MLTVKNKTILLFGYYGKSNIGDDIMLINIVDLLVRKKTKKIVVLVDKSFNMEEDFDSSVVFLKGLKNNILSFLIQLIKVDYFIWGGGTCFFDNPSNRGLKELLYFTSLRKIISKNKKNFFIGIGVEKVEKSKILIRRILSYTDGVILRDKISRENLLYIDNTFNHKTDFIEVYDDMVLMNTTKNILNKKAISITSNKYITFSGHYKYENNDKVVKHTAKELKKVMDRLNIYHVVFLPAKYDKKGDCGFHLNVKNELISNKKYNLEIPEIKHIYSYIGILKKTQKHIGMRLHSLVLSDIFLIPNIALAYQEKIYQYNKEAKEVLSNWSSEKFIEVEGNRISNLLENNTNKYESFFK